MNTGPGYLTISFANDRNFTVCQSHAVGLCSMIKSSGCAIGFALLPTSRLASIGQVSLIIAFANMGILCLDFPASSVVAVVDHRDVKVSGKVEY